MQRRIYVVVFLAVFGILGVIRSVGNPRTAMLRGSDIVQLVGAGMCFGLAFGMLVARRRFPGESPLP